MTTDEIIDALYWIRHISGLNIYVITDELLKKLPMSNISKEDFINRILLEIHKQSKLQNFNWLWD